MLNLMKNTILNAKTETEWEEYKITNIKDDTNKITMLIWLYIW